MNDKLRLRRTTLRQLTPALLGQVKGGISSAICAAAAAKQKDRPIIQGGDGDDEIKQ